MKSEEEIRKRIEYLDKVNAQIPSDITEIFARIFELRWVLED